MTQPRKIGLKLKTSMAFSAVFTALALVFNLNSYQHIKADFIEDNNRFLLSRAYSLLEKTEVNPAIIPLPDKDHYIRVFYHANNQYRLVFESPGLPYKILTPTHTGISDTLGMRIAYVQNTGNKDENLAELLLITSAAPLNERIQSLIQLLFLSSLFSVLIAGCFSYLLAGILLSPLKKIIAIASSINANRLSNLIPVRRSGDELEELTKTINNMLGRISEGIKQQQIFFASASHELKTPLAVLRAELELNLNKTGNTNALSSLLESQLTEIKRLQERIDEFLVISQLKEGTLKLHITHFDISSSIIQTFKQLMPLLILGNLTPSIRFDPESDGYSLEADEDKIRMILINLLENAIKYAVPGTTLYCRVQKKHPDNHILIELQNFIADEKIETTYLQNAFFRSDHRQRGAGLGLWLCAEIVRLHSGTLTLDGKDHQFSVTIELPSDKHSGLPQMKQS